MMDRRLFFSIFRFLLSYLLISVVSLNLRWRCECQPFMVSTVSECDPTITLKSKSEGEEAQMKLACTSTIIDAVPLVTVITSFVNGGGEWSGDFLKLSGIITPGFASGQLRVWSILDCSYSPLDFNPLDMVWLKSTKARSFEISEHSSCVSLSLPLSITFKSKSEGEEAQMKMACTSTIIVAVPLVTVQTSFVNGGGEWFGVYSKLSGIIISGFASGQLRVWSIVDCPYSYLDFNPLDVVWLNSTKGAAGLMFTSFGSSFWQLPLCKYCRADGSHMKHFSGRIRNSQSTYLCEEQAFITDNAGWRAEIINIEVPCIHGSSPYSSITEAIETNFSSWECALTAQSSFSAHEIADGTFFKATKDYDADNQRLLYQLHRCYISDPVLNPYTPWDRRLIRNIFCLLCPVTQESSIVSCSQSSRHTAWCADEADILTTMTST